VLLCTERGDIFARDTGTSAKAQGKKHEAQPWSPLGTLLTADGSRTGSDKHKEPKRDNNGQVNGRTDSGNGSGVVLSGLSSHPNPERHTKVSHKERACAVGDKKGPTSFSPFSISLKGVGD
jgi:hypothetical protein